jgi:hypothetical protein
MTDKKQIEDTVDYVMRKDRELTDKFSKAEIEVIRKFVIGGLICMMNMKEY